jgi:hypothetical protein
MAVKYRQWPSGVLDVLSQLCLQSPRGRFCGRACWSERRLNVESQRATLSEGVSDRLEVLSFHYGRVGSPGYFGICGEDFEFLSQLVELRVQVLLDLRIGKLSVNVGQFVWIFFIVNERPLV